MKIGVITIFPRAKNHMDILAMHPIHIDRKAKYSWQEADMYMVEPAWCDLLGAVKIE